MYFERYKADHTIFEGIPKIDMGGTILRGILPHMLEAESKMYLINSKDELTRKYLPAAYADNEEEALKKLNDYIDRFLLKAGILFSIATKEKSIPVGYILCNSPATVYPDSKEAINDWTIDFWLREQVRGRGIMTAAVYNVLGYLQRMEVPRVYAFVDKTNEISIKILKKCHMIQVDETYDKKMYKFGIRLKNPEVPL